MLGAPDFAHAAPAEQLDQVVAAELLRLAQAPADAAEARCDGNIATMAQA